MKTRTGFVSNSSSSSFIVSFSEDPANINNLREMMAGCGQEDHSYYPMTEDAVIDRVFDDVLAMMPATEQEISDEISSDVYYEVSQEVKINDYRKPDGYVDWARYDAARKIVRERLMGPKMKRFMADNRNKYVYIFEYSDNGDDCCLETGDIFSGNDYIRISHH